MCPKRLYTVCLEAIVPVAEESLRDSSDAVLRLFLLAIWLGNDVDIDNWGWKHFNNMFIPITMNQLPAPDHLLQTLFCNCKRDVRLLVVVERVASTVV
ncbi:hypothetical protein TNCV_4217311 [Trichonephila clavipes]|nr:hypothetical protein TNCV_4217311 [Trichonephila clavipes]